MKAVGIAELKAHLSRYIHAVRRGQTVTVLDRKEPVARVVPITSERIAYLDSSVVKRGQPC